jgi:hypothetical protein
MYPARGEPRAVLLSTAKERFAQRNLSIGSKSCIELTDWGSSLGRYSDAPGRKPRNSSKP